MASNEGVKEFYNALHSIKKKNRKPYSPQTIKSYMLRFKQIVDFASKNGLVKYDVNPFIHIHFIQDIARENKVSNEDLLRLWQYVPSDKTEAFAKDMFFISFFTGGMNMRDIICAKFDGDTIEYKRHKIESRTNGRYTIRIKVFPELRQIINRYIDEETGKLDFRKGGVIKQASYDNYDDARLTHNVSAILSYIYRDIGAKLDIKELTFYSARRCFAQIGLNLGISDSVIDYLLGHTPTRRGIISAYSRVNEELGVIAMELIFEYAFHPTDLRQIFRNNILSKLKN